MKQWKLTVTFYTRFKCYSLLYSVGWEFSKLCQAITKNFIN
jgi:hypothetical protein